MHAGGRDVFRGVAIDYMGEDVNVRTLLAVLEGNKEAVASLGTGKVRTRVTNRMRILCRCIVCQCFVCGCSHACSSARRR